MKAKKIVRLVAALLLVLLAAAMLLPFLIPVDAYKQQIAKRVKDATGRDFVIEGEMRATLLPAPGLRLEKIRLANPKGYSTPSMLEAQSLTVQLALRPLLSRRVQVTQLRLEQPVLHLEVSAEGVPNWRFTPERAATEMPVQFSAPPLALISAAYAAEGEAPPRLVREVLMEGMTVKGGTLHYRDMRAKKAYTLSDIGLRMMARSLQEPVRVVGDARWSEEKLSLDATLDTPSALLEEKPANLTLSLNAAPLALSYRGQVTQNTAQGALDASTPSLPRLAAWAGSPLAWRGEQPLALAVKGDLACTAAQCTAHKSDIRLDRDAFTGDVGVYWAGRPRLTADVSTASLNLNAYLSTQRKAETGRWISSAHAQEWSDAPIDLAALRGFDADIKLQAGSLVVDRFTLSDVRLDTALKSGVLHLLVPAAKLYGGSGNADITMDAGAAPKLHAVAQLSGLAAETLLKDFANVQSITGTTALSFDVTSHGGSARQLIQALGGSAKFMVIDGAFKGINLAQVVRTLRGTFTGEAGGVQRTDFSELGGTFAIAGGVLRNSDLAMKAPLIRLKGDGTIDLPKRWLHYRLVPELVGSLKGQGGKDKEGVAVPVIVEGPFGNLSFRPDLEAVGREALQDPGKIKETVKSVRDQVKNGLKKNPDAVRGMLEGVFGGKSGNLLKDLGQPKELPPPPEAPAPATEGR